MTPEITSLLLSCDDLKGLEEDALQRLEEGASVLSLAANEVLSLSAKDGDEGWIKSASSLRYLRQEVKRGDLFLWRGFRRAVRRWDDSRGSRGSGYGRRIAFPS